VLDPVTFNARGPAFALRVCRRAILALPP